MNPPPSASKGGSEPPKDAVKVEFARRLQAAMLRKFGHQSELARAAEQYLPPGKKFGRDNISLYIRGFVLPGPAKLNALCMALGVTKEDLLPVKGYRTAGDENPAIDIRDVGDGNMWLRINRAVRSAAAAQILQILAKEDSTDGSGGGAGNVSGHDEKKDNGNSGSQLAVPA